MKHGARNDIPAEVIEIKTGGVMAQVKVNLVGADYEMSSVMTKDSLDKLGIEKDGPCRGQGGELAAVEAVTRRLE